MATSFTLLPPTTIHTPSSTLVAVPGPTLGVQPNFGHLLIKGDVLYPKGEEPYTGYDLNARIALFVLAQATPIISAILLIFSRKGWWRPKFYWTFSRLIALWLISVQIFAAIVYVQKGATTRVLFLAGALHLQIEYMIISLLLKSSGLTALIVAYVGGTILYTIQLFVKDLSVVFMITTIAGFSDFLIPLLCAYGGQWLYAIGGFAHLAQAISVFCIVVKNYGHVNFDVVTWLTLWIMNGALVAAVFQARHRTQAIRLEDSADGSVEGETDSKQAADNPLADLDIPRPHLIAMFAVAIVGSIISAFVFTFVVARN